MTQTHDPLLALERSLTPAERAVIDAYVKRHWPRLVGATPADVLEHTTDYDMFLDQTEPFYEACGDQLPAGTPNTAALHLLIILGRRLTPENLRAALAQASLLPPGPAQVAYDPIADLAALIDGVHELAAKGGDRRELQRLLTGPYARLRGGLLLDETGPAAPRGGTDQALRAALQSFITRTGHLITPAELDRWAAEAERGADVQGLGFPGPGEDPRS